MDRVTPCMRDHVNALRPRLQPAPDGHQTPRLQRLSLRARGQAPSRLEGAQRLGGHRQTLGRWVAL